jgi:hypothetical protein
MLCFGTMTRQQSSAGRDSLQTQADAIRRRTVGRGLEYSGQEAAHDLRGECQRVIAERPQEILRQAAGDSAGPQHILRGA